MTESFSGRRIGVAITLSTLLLGAASLAGTIGTRWDPVSGGGVVGYRVFHGASSGSYDQFVDVGLVTETTLTALPDCGTRFVAVKARNAAGDLSEGFSNEISGWPRPEIASTDRSQWARGASYTVAIDGTNFRPGSQLNLSVPSLAVSGVTVESCGRLSFTVDVPVGAPLGSVDVGVVHPDGVFGAAVALFEVVPDQSGPAISGVTTDAVGGTTATISWQTDEAADGTLSLRRVGDPDYQSFTDPAADGTDHSVALTGLTPETQYQFFVSSVDGGGNTSSSGTSSFTTGSSAFDYLPLEAEWASMTVPLVIVGDGAAFSGEAIALPNGSGVGNPGSPVGRGTTVFDLPGGGSWHVWLRVFAPDAGARRWLVGFDGGSLETVSAAAVGEWSWIEASTVTLAAGEHTLDLGGADPEARLDRVLLTDDAGFLPSLGPGGDTTSPGAVGSLTATPGDGLVDVAWFAPLTNDLRRIVVRARSDGRFPAHPYDGVLVYDAPSTPGAAGSFRDDGLTNGTTVRYAVFAIDDADNASVAATVAATPAAAAQPPADVENLVRTDVVE